MQLKSKMLDENGSPIVNATVSIRRVNADETTTDIGIPNTTTDANGVWEFTGLTDGLSYEVTLAAADYWTRKIYGKTWTQVEGLAVTGHLDTPASTMIMLQVFS